MDTVALLKIRGSFEETLREAIRLIGGLKELESPLIIKPNICTGNDHTNCANTKVEVIETLVEEILRENEDIEIRMVESDSMSKYADKAFERYGYKEYVDRKSSQGVNISLTNLSKSPLTEYKFEGAYFKNPELPVSGKPATAENVVTQIKEPFSSMPSFSYLTDEEVSDIVTFLNTL